jgi:hypothetical protein
MVDSLSDGTSERTELGAWKGFTTAGVVLLIVMVRYFNPSASSNSFESLFAGYNVVMALGIYYLIRWLFGKYSKASLEFACFIVILAAFIGGDYIGKHEKTTKIGNDNPEITVTNQGPAAPTKTVNIVTSTNTAEEQPILSDLKVGTADELVVDEITAVDSYQLNAYKTLHTNKLRTLFDQYNQSSGNELNKLLDAKRIAEDKSYPVSALKILNAKEILFKLESDYKAIMDQVPSDINKLPMSELAKREMLASFNRAKIDEDASANFLFEIELETLNVFEKIVDFLESSRKRWVVVNNEFIFYEKSDAIIFNEMVDNIERLKQERLKKARGTN